MTELNPTGSALVYSTYHGGSSYDSGLGIAVDTSGNACVTGWTESTDFPTSSGAFQRTSGRGPDAFVAKFDTDGIGIVLTASRHRMGETAVVRLVWTGTNSPKVDIYRDGVQIARVPNTGRYRDSLTAHQIYTYGVCEVRSTTNCSNEVTVKGP